MNRREFIKSFALGVGAITVPLLARPEPTMDLTEQALEDMLVRITNNHYLTDTNAWFLRTDNPDFTLDDMRHSFTPSYISDHA